MATQVAQILVVVKTTVINIYDSNYITFSLGSLVWCCCFHWPHPRKLQNGKIMPLSEWVLSGLLVDNVSRIDYATIMCAFGSLAVPSKRYHCSADTKSWTAILRHMGERAGQTIGASAFSRRSSPKVTNELRNKHRLWTHELWPFLPPTLDWPGAPVCK